MSSESEARNKPDPAAVVAPFELYGRDAQWWPAVSSPLDYAEEARFFYELLRGPSVGRGDRLRALELGSGGGHLASNLRDRAEFTLVDRSPQMLELSRLLVPEFEHIEGDMRSVRLGRTFDAVLVHDACCFLEDLASLRQAMATAFEHCRAGGTAVFAPDYVRETFAEETEEGSGEADAGSLRYLSWVHDPDPSDTAIQVDTAYLLREAGDQGAIRVAHERHIEGLFGREDWLRALEETGFEATCVAFEHPEEPPSERILVARRPG